MIEFKNLPLDELKVAHLTPFKDKRGAFYRLFCSEKFNNVLNGKNIVQINLSITKKNNTIRGMHFQHPPFSEIKIIKCLKGSVFDVLVDLRKDSETFLQWHGVELNAINDKMIVIPEGFAHGFQTLTDDVELLYLHTESYNSNAEDGIKHNDARINIKWPYPPINISERDENFKLLDENFKGF